jgi:glycine dehydrogenase subunit 1
MPFIPHTKNQIESMLKTIGANTIDELFDEIPNSLRCDLDTKTASKKSGLENIAEGLNENAVQQLINQRANQDGTPICFAGAGAYDHYIPAAIWEIATRGEFYSAYTPYQAEASQGTLQLIYEFQTMVASLTAMDVANASLYDGASALAEAILMAIRSNKKSKSKTILVPNSLSPVYRQVAHSITHNQGIKLKTIDLDDKTGQIKSDFYSSDYAEKFAALVIPLPNYLGHIEEVHQLTDWAHKQGALVIAVINPIALGLYEAPGNWGEKGADIVIAEGQPLGIPIASGGPYLGLMACKMGLVRQLPGRIIGKTEDIHGKTGFTLTLQAREQHIRRSKATSNICTNQGLLATAATIYMSLMGADGIKRVALKSVHNTLYLKQQLLKIEGINEVFSSHHFHEVLLSLPVDSTLFIKKMANRNIVAGYSLKKDYPQFGNSLLICATEKRTTEEMDRYVSECQIILASILAEGV